MVRVAMFYPLASRRLPGAALLISVLTSALAAAGGAACSAADQAPLGGPYGGVSTGTPAPGGTGSPAASDAGAAASDAGEAKLAEDGASPPAAVACAPAAAPSTPSPTFTSIYTTYFAPKAPADCVTGTGCHTQFQTEQGAWAFLLQWDQVGTSPPGLTDPNKSWLSWYGGLMPQTGTACNPQAVADLNAWAAAGGKND
jgi:hypothetical protein